MGTCERRFWRAFFIKSSFFYEIIELQGLFRIFTLLKSLDNHDDGNENIKKL